MDRVAGRMDEEVFVVKMRVVMGCKKCFCGIF